MEYSYDASKFGKIGNFYVPTFPIIAGPVTYVSVEITYVPYMKNEFLKMKIG